MIMRVVYFADDGTQFDTEEECEQYEYVNSMKDKFPTTRFFNRIGKEVPFLATTEFCENIFYLDVRDLDEATLLHQWFQDCGFDSPWKPERWRDGATITIGYFFYDTDEDKWRNIEELYEAYQKVLNIFEGE
jgi:hypothetical protein